MIKNGKIELFNSQIIVDNNLPKHKKVETGNYLVNSSNGVINWDGGTTGESSSRTSNNDSNLDYLEYLYEHNPSLLLKFRIFLYKKLFSRHFSIENSKQINLEKLKLFFDEVKNNVSELEKTSIDSVLNKYTTVLENAEYNNQIALVERIKDYSVVLKDELVLSTSKFNRYLTDEDIIKFHNKASVHEKYKTCLCLTYVKNFVKIIPNEITELRKQADELRVFDNYVILHYDYSGKSVSDTKEEIAKKKDPILFGVIKNSRRLYYIGDWIDDYCDLTLDVIIDKLGEDVVGNVDEFSIISELENM